jgi:VanZ family protein
MGFIYYLSAQPQPPTLAEPLLQTILSYGFHVAEYAILAALIFWALGDKPRRKVLLISILIVGLYAVSDEYHQSFVPNRSSDMLDVLADLIGAGLILAWFRRFR